MNTSKTLKKEWYVLVILLLPFIASAILWNDLPDQVPVHFNIHGEADDYGPKWMNAIMLPVIGIAVYFLLIFLPAIDPKKRIESTQKPIAAIRIITSVFFVTIYGIVMAITLGYQIDMGNYIFIVVGLLFMVLGNYMNSVKPNYFIGIRTPWTLENPEVWKKTHRLGSKLWIIGGLLFILVPLLFGISETVFITLTLFVIAILVGVPVVYSYIMYKNNQT
ncbi:MAG: SdpI family protein [Balneola sp.]